jgi:AcrR family transcriptional regulator
LQGLIAEEGAATVEAMRADAQRNRAELLDAARLVIAEQGVDASLRDIARRAGVGIGTLYRHFPTREALLAALVSSGVDRMCALAADLAATRSPGDAIGTWLSELARRWGPYKGLPGSLLSAMTDKGSDMHDTCGAMVDAGRDLFAAAQSAGEIRADVTWDEVFTAVTAVSWAAAQSSPERADRILAVFLDGLRPALR